MNGFWEQKTTQSLKWKILASFMIKCLEGYTFGAFSSIGFKQSHVLAIPRFLGDQTKKKYKQNQMLSLRMATTKCELLNKGHPHISSITLLVYPNLISTNDKGTLANWVTDDTWLAVLIQIQL